MAVGDELDFSPTSSSTTVAGTNTLSRPMTKSYKSPKTAKLTFGAKSKFGIGMPKLIPSKGGMGGKRTGMPKIMSKR